MSSHLSVLALSVSGCGGSDSDYYYLAEIRGQGDTIVMRFAFTCGQIEVHWNSGFAGHEPTRAELTISHDSGGDDCEEGPRTVPFDMAPMKQAFREQHPLARWLSLRVPPYDDTHGAVCLDNVFQTGPFEGARCD